MRVTKEILNEYFEYKDGDIFWKKLSPRNYSTKVGDRVGCATSTGRLSFKFFGTNLQNHRAIFLMHHGYLPEVVDHADGNFLNNKIENLRHADKVKNGQNSKIPKSNTSGIKGVDFHSKKWRARIAVSGKSIYVGSFKTLQDAECAIEAARKKHHENFARSK
jgi:hypothetical protein